MEIPRHWRLQDQRYNLTGTVCTRCGKVFFTPRPVCTECNTPVDEVDRQFAEQRTARRVAPVIEPAQR